MKALIQRVRQASVTVEGSTVGQIGPGMLVLLGVANGDTAGEAAILARKIVNLRIFPDENGKMNRSIGQIGGAILAVSQFTLLANCRHGNRPDFFASAPPAVANELYEIFKKMVAAEGIPTQSGIFGADMQVALVNDGPVTILLDTDALKSK